MDLLAGYGTDDSSQASSDGDDTASSAVQSSTSLNPSPSPTNTSDTSKAKVVKKLDDDGKANNKQISMKSKRLLRLNAVLPSEIFDRLTRSTVRGDDEDSSSSSDSEDDGDGNPTTSSKKKPLTSRKKLQGALSQKNNAEFVGNRCGDVGLTNLLSELHNIKSTNTKHKNHQKDDTPTETMGLAFTQVSSNVVRKKRKSGTDGNDVVDIHSSSIKKPSVTNEKITVEDVHSDDDSDKASEDLNTTTTEEKSVPLFPSISVHNQEKLSMASSHQEPVVQDRSSATTTARYVSSTIPRPSVSSSRFVPSVPASFQMHKTPSQIHRQPSTIPQRQNQSSTTIYHHQQEQQHHYQQQQQQQQQPNSKKSRKMLEKALRSGDFSGIEQSATTVTGSVMTDSYTPNAGNVNIRADEDDGGGGRASYMNLPTYVPSEGNSVNQNEISSKQKGKHQIHSLVASAAKLQSQRLRASAMGLGNNTNNRADAKRKYGW